MAKAKFIFNKSIKDMFVSFFLAPTFLLFLIILAKIILKGIPEISGDPFFYIFIPLSITVFLMGVVSLAFRINTFLWILLFIRSPGGYSSLISYYLDPKSQSYKVIKFVSIACIALGLLGIAFSIAVLFLV